MRIIVKNYIETEFTHLLNNPCDEEYMYFIGILRMAKFLKEITEEKYAYYRNEALSCM